MVRSVRSVAAATAVALVIALAAPSAPVVAQGTTSKTPAAGAPMSGGLMTKIATADVAAILDDAGVRYEITTDDVGDPLIVAEGTPVLVGEKMAVFFYSCDQAGCEDIRMYTYFRSRSGATLEQVNAFNQDLRWGRTFLDEDNDPVLELDINATGGIGREALRILVNTYLSSMNTFAAHVDAP